MEIPGHISTYAENSECYRASKIHFPQLPDGYVVLQRESWDILRHPEDILDRLRTFPYNLAQIGTFPYNLVQIGTFQDVQRCLHMSQDVRNRADKFWLGLKERFRIKYSTDVEALHPIIPIPPTAWGKGFFITIYKKRIHFDPANQIAHLRKTIDCGIAVEVKRQFTSQTMQLSL